LARRERYSQATLVLHHRRFAWRWKAARLALLLVLIAACGSRSKATVTGTVKYKGEPVPSGQVIFYGAGDQSAIAMINDDGSYKATNVPLGPVKVALVTPPSTAGMEKAAKVMKTRFGKGNAYPESVKAVSLPKRFSDPAKSGLGLTVTQGTQPYNININ
jgi:hypothetical protein